MGLGLWFIVILAGAMGQFVDTLAGMGFGAFSSSFMIAGGVAPALVVATVNVAKVGSGLFSGLAHWRFGNVRWKWAGPLALSGVAGGVLGGSLLVHIPQGLTRFWLPVLLLLMGLLLLRRFLFEATAVPSVVGASTEWDPPARAGLWWNAVRKWKAASTGVQLAVIGLFGGVINGLSGAYGPFTTTSVLLTKGGHPRYSVGSVNLAEFFVAGAVSVAILSQINWAEFGWQLPVGLIAGSILTAPLGAYLSRRLPLRSIGVLMGIAMVGLNVFSLLRSLA